MILQEIDWDLQKRPVVITRERAGISITKRSIKNIGSVNCIFQDSIVCIYLIWISDEFVSVISITTTAVSNL